MARDGSETKKERNETLCLTVAREISNIVRFSVDERFRKQSFKALGVQSTKDVERVIFEKLIACIEKPNQSHQIQSSEEKDNDDANLSVNSQISAEQGFTTSVYSQNWLQFSILHKKRKLSLATQCEDEQFHSGFLPNHSQKL